MGNFTFLNTHDEQKRVAALMWFNKNIFRSFEKDFQ